MYYNEDDYLMLSGIQHFIFCQRQWALIHIEQQWSENYLTVDGSLMHKHAHNADFIEKRGNIIITRGLPVFSRTMGVSGICDVIEFIRDNKGIPIQQFDGLYRVEPVEYKHGNPKEGSEDIMQLTAEVMCLEEMLSCEIPCASLYYGETRHRLKVEITDSLRNQVRDAFELMHQYMNRGYTPKVKNRKKCNSCSLKNECLPRLNKSGTVKSYISTMIGEE